jgi:NADH-quinone oxidoreductase subunit J
MTIGSIYFFLCAIACIAGALVTVVALNPIRGALGLLLTILGIAGMYLKLHAQFLAAVQVIVYAGAVVILFVFVLMLLGADAMERGTNIRRSPVARIAGGFGIAAIILVTAYRSIQVYLPTTSGHFPTSLVEDFGSVKSVGQQLFTEALAPFELSTALLIVAVIGAIAVAKVGHRKAVPTPNSLSNAHRFFGGPVQPHDAARPIAKDSTP